MSSQRIVILGAGESGIGAAVLAKKKDYEVFVTDNGIIKQNFKNVLLHNNIDFEEGKHNLDKILIADEIVKSPGIPDNISLIKNIKRKQIKIISEIEFAGRFTKAKKICITGSNGKTTTTLWIYHILKKAGFNVGLAGNVGNSFAMQVATEDFDLYVLELSSFQLDYMFEFKADMAIITNITPDHLDRYDYDFNKYRKSKFKILQNQTKNDAFIYCLDDKATIDEIKKRKIKAQKYGFTYRNMNNESAYVENNELTININKEKLKMTLEQLALQGRHNLYNSMASGITARLMDIRKEVIKLGLSDFQGVAHRLESIGKIHGIEFINDSKATNVNSTWYALESVNKPLIWIVGGIDKGNDYNQIKDLVKEKVKAIICLGKDNQKIYDAFDGTVEIMDSAVSAQEAVEKAFAVGKQGDVVMLSPACASFDLFENYEDRGNQFKKAVRDL